MKNIISFVVFAAGCLFSVASYSHDENRPIVEFIFGVNSGGSEVDYNDYVYARDPEGVLYANSENVRQTQRLYRIPFRKRMPALLERGKYIAILEMQIQYEYCFNFLLTINENTLIGLEPTNDFWAEPIHFEISALIPFLDVRFDPYPGCAMNLVSWSLWRLNV